MDSGLLVEDLMVEGMEESKSGLSWDSIKPNEGLYLGLDISEESTGICLVENGEKVTGNIVLTGDRDSIQKSEKSCFIEVLLRRALKRDLTEIVSGKDFDLIIIEDAFTGVNPKVARLLYALNTAIDELILDCVCTCKEFRRVSNGTWKSWLWSVVDKEGKYKGLNDKVKIKECLADIGIEEGLDVGYQDRLDATGMLVGYLLNKDKILEDDEIGEWKRITWSNLDFTYELDQSLVFEGRNWLRELPVVYIDLKRFTKKAVLNLVRRSPESLFITKTVVSPGILGVNIGLDAITDGGYLAFWVKKSVRKRLFSR